MKTAVVTGATGFLGSYLVCYLISKNYKVIGLYRNEPRALFNTIAGFKNADSSLIDWKQATIDDPEVLATVFAGVDVVFHCAAEVSFENKDKALLYQTNVEGTKNVVNACLRAGVKNLVHVSSVAAIGRKRGEQHITEENEWVESTVNSMYGITKHLAELEVWRGMEEGLNVAIVNPGIIIGAGDGHSGSNRMFEHIKSGSRFYPAGINGFVGVDDVVKMMVSIFENGYYGKRYLSISENLSYKTVLEMIAKTLGLKAPHKALKGSLLSAGVAVARLAEVFRLPFPFPSVGLKSTSSVCYYNSVQKEFLPPFEYTPIAEVVEAMAGVMG